MSIIIIRVFKAKISTTCIINVTDLSFHSLIDFSNGSVVIPMSSSKCTCYSSQSARSTSRGLAIAVCSIIIGLTLTLLLSITVVAYRNYRIMSQ